MKRLAEFLKTTLIGGLLVVVPIYLTALLVAKAIVGLLAVVAPITAGLPASVHWRDLAALGIVVLVCFIAGLVVRTGPGLRMKDAFERVVLVKVPGYSLVRSVAARMAGTAEGSTFAVALVEIEDALVPAFIVEELPGDQYTVFVPSVPTPAAGAIYILPKARVHPVDVPFTSAVGVISNWGNGAGELVRALERGRRGLPAG